VNNLVNKDGQEIMDKKAGSATMLKWAIGFILSILYILVNGGLQFSPAILSPSRNTGS
jgi:hypothetical protein